jgi:hypothetical protein
MTSIASKEATKALITEQLAAHSRGIVGTLESYAPSDTATKWHETIRRVEEFINLPLFSLEDSSELYRVLQIPVDLKLVSEPGEISWLKAFLTSNFSSKLSDRFFDTLLQFTAINNAFAAHDFDLNIRTIGDAVGYFQSRRRHFVALLYTIPYACRGNKEIAAIDTLNHFLPLIEHSGLTLVGLHHQAVLNRIFPDYQITIDDKGFQGNYYFEHLDMAFLDPERASIIDMAEVRSEHGSTSHPETLDLTKIFSKAELKNSISLIEASYAEFKLKSPLFDVLKEIILFTLDFCVDDYFITIPQTRLLEFIARYHGLSNELRDLLIHIPSDYLSSLDSFQPFIPIDSIYMSNVNLAMRFIYYFKNKYLHKQKRFQIHSGFIFEDIVKQRLTSHGFFVTDIKRINKKEFDVVTTKDNKIHNFQCKNNWVDLSKIGRDDNLFIRYNEYLVQYYKRALEKEEKREDLLLKRLGLSTIRHYVISRFPVITQEPRIICFNKIDSL